MNKTLQEMVDEANQLFIKRLNGAVLSRRGEERELMSAASPELLAANERNEVELYAASEYDLGQWRVRP